MHLREYMNSLTDDELAFLLEHWDEKTADANALASGPAVEVVSHKAKIRCITQNQEPQSGNVVPLFGSES